MFLAGLALYLSAQAPTKVGGALPAGGGFWGTFQPYGYGVLLTVFLFFTAVVVFLLERRGRGVAPTDSRSASKNHHASYSSSD